jgi:hypothetical protein
VGDCDVVVAIRARRKKMVTTGVGTNLWHLDLGLRFLGVVGGREACDVRRSSYVSAWTLKVQRLVELVSVLARAGPREYGA